ncbi:MAG TPA: ChaN family lipoprotein, partial [Kofleriaceae bacterium]|nr:ChaN family lipoprotein [Kofleriaceae bacterium]
MATRSALCMLLVATVGCGGTYGGGTTTPTKSAAAKGGIAQAALPYQVLDGRSGRQVEEVAFWSRLAGARAVCVGEEHPNPHHHWVQLRIVEELG